ncbi:MAG: putative membrane protein [Candidatus Woesebacteria bacterium GW2011_GWA1_39_8]|jgi:putative membrane protein|uniref:Putative membrane protein n=1 Tax=Candidatus Woesebacteria bacterium GW2011_GWA1_39_8 TaxID=1618552 RepID=A0A0G0PN36_9BACT|nr:MAG: putative membrane protein [Candidatus Woesebacteria bacterium GW2011_GWA1_39_8]
MKRLIRHYAIETYALYLTSLAASGMVFDKGLKTILFAGLMLTIANLFAKPVINLLLLPVNLVTFGIFRWVSSAITLYLVTLLVHDFKVTAFTFAGFSSKWIDIPEISFTGVLAFIGFSLFLSVITSFIFWLAK